MSYQFTIVGTTTADKVFGNLGNVSIANAFRNIGKHFEDVAIGAVSEVVTLNSGPVKATGTITIAVGNMSSADTITINGVTLTAETSPSGAQQFAVGASALITALNLMACINNNQIIIGATATYAKSSTSGVVTVTALGAGSAGDYAWSQSGSNVTLSPASALSGGQNGPVAATSTWTFASTGPTNNETCTVANITFTAKTSGATGNQFNISATPSVVAANFAAAINASPNLKGICTAVAASGVVTLTAAVPGLIGNGIETGVGNLANTTVVAFGGSGAVAGANALVQTFHKGI
jgi:hypothetical protein